MVASKKVKLEGEIEVDIPLDIIEDKYRLKAIEEDLVGTISKSLYEQAVSFKITKTKLKPSFINYYNDAKTYFILVDLNE